jgi:NAD(P)-dependent dehydrogenase (short-subunit alcohol dehydrogenase family)
MSNSIDPPAAWNPMEMRGRTVLVTGASSGIGRETAIFLSRLGARLILVSRRREALASTCSALVGEGHLIEPYDLADLAGIPDWMHEVVGRSGPLHGLVHSAGVQTLAPLRSLSLDSLHQTLDVNLSAAIQLSKGFRYKGHCQPESSIVFLASVMAFAGEAGRTAYAASKGALTSAVRVMALELARSGIRVNCVAPGLVRTEMADAMNPLLTPEQLAAIEKMHPLGIGKPEDVSAAIAFLLADTGRWITGTSLVVDGGYLSH